MKKVYLLLVGLAMIPLNVLAASVDKNNCLWLQGNANEAQNDIFLLQQERQDEYYKMIERFRATNKNLGHPTDVLNSAQYKSLNDLKKKYGAKILEKQREKILFNQVRNETGCSTAFAEVKAYVDAKKAKTNQDADDELAKNDTK